MINVIKCIAGLVLFIYKLKEFSVSSKEIGDCDIKTDYEGNLMANCSQRKLTSVPQDLPTDITVLDISFNDIKTLSKSSLKNYRKLKKFSMENLSVTSFPHRFFKYTPELVTLNISNTQITNLGEIPRSLTVLNFTECNFEYVDLSHLVNLEELFMRYGRLKKVPILTKGMAIQRIDLKFNPLTEADYNQIASYCKLKYFGLNSTELRDEKYLVQCCGFKYWASQREIESGYKLQGCGHPKADYSACKSLEMNTFDKSALDDYRACRHGNFLKYIVLAILVGFLVIISAGLLEVLIHHLYVIGAFERWFPKHREDVIEELSDMEVGSEHGYEWS